MVLNLFELAEHLFVKKKLAAHPSVKMTRIMKIVLFLHTFKDFLDMAAHLKKSTAHRLRNTAVEYGRGWVS